MDQGHTHHALCDGADVAVARRARLVPRGSPARRCKTETQTRAAFAERHEDAGEHEGGDQCEKAAADAGDEAERRPGEVADFGCMLCTKAGRSSCAWLHRRGASRR